MNPSRITRPEARVLAQDEFVRFADTVASLTPDEWAMPTECTGWDVRKMALHVLGSGEAQASVREFIHQLRRGMPLNHEIDSHHWVDGLNELQIREREHLSNDELAAELAAIGPKAVKGRWRTPPPMRHLPLPFGPPIGWAPLKYLLDVGFTPFELVLDGPAGGKFTQGVGGERVEIDACDFIRTLSGRLPGAGVLSHPLPL